MTKDRMALIAGTILSLGLLTACGGDGDPEDTDATGRATPKASASAAKRTGPAYDGAALPGLSKEPAWSLKGDGTSGCVADPAASAARHVINIDVRTCVLGDAVVLTQDMTEYSQAGSVASEEYHFRARFHDAATGKVRRTVDVTVPADWPGGRELRLDQFIQISQWEDGSPALLVVEGDVVVPDGLKKETVSTTYTMYAPSGEKLGSSTLEGEDADNLTAEAGHLLTEEGNKSSTYTPVGGGATVEVRNRGVDQAPLGAGFGYRVGSTYSAVDGSGSRLSVSDRLTGKELWDLGDVDRPAALADVEEVGDLEGSLYALTQDKGLLAWELPDDDTYDVVLTVVDLATGRLLAEGPKAKYGETLNARVASVLTSDGGTAVTQLGGGAVAWNTETGAELWRQAADEQSITPLALPTADVLYASADDLGLTALDMGTKKVLASRLVPDITSELTADGDVLQLTTGGYGVLASGYDLFVFAPETKQ